MSRTVQILGFLLLLLGVLYVRYFNVYTSSYIQENTPLQALVNYIVFYLLVTVASSVMHYVYTRRSGKNEKDNIHFGIENITKLVLGMGFVVMLFGVVGIDIRSLLTSLSIVAAAIAIISKDFVNDFLIGLYFSFSKNFEINDYIQLENHRGKIIEIGMLKVKLLNDDDDVVIIPNGKIYINEIINYTKRDIRLMNIDFQIDIQKVESIEVFEQELIGSLHDFSEYIEQESYNLKIEDVKKDYLDMKFQYTLKKFDRELQRRIRKKTVRQVFNYISSKW